MQTPNITKKYDDLCNACDVVLSHIAPRQGGKNIELDNALQTLASHVHRKRLLTAHLLDQYAAVSA